MSSAKHRWRRSDVATLLGRVGGVALRWRAEPGWPLDAATPSLLEFGISSQEMARGTASYARLIHPEDRARVETELDEIAHAGGHLAIQELRLVASSGAVRWVEQRVGLRRDAAGRVTHFEGLVLEITGRRAERTRAERSARLLNFATDHLREAVYLIDRNARFHYVNEAACRALGYTREQLLGMSVPDIDPDFSMARWVAEWPTWLAQRSAALETRHRSRDGRVFPVEVYASFIEFDGEFYNMALIRDITERKRAERTARLLNFALNHVREAAYLIDRNARFHYVNEEACRALGYTREQLLGMSVPDIDPDFSMEHWVAAWPTWVAQQSAALETRHRSRDGRVFPVEVYASFIEFDGEFYSMSLIRDITERKRAQDLLRAREQQLRTLLDNLPDAVAWFDERGRIIDMNASSKHISGVGDERDLGKTTLETEYPSGSAVENRKLFDALTLAIREGAPTALESRWQTASGERVFEVRHVPVTDERGRTVSAIGIGRDITARKRAEVERERLLAEVEEERRRLQAVLDTAPVGIAVFRAPDGYLTLINGAADAIMGLPGAGPELSVAERARSYDVRLPTGAPCPPDDLPVVRSLRGETVTGAELLIRQPSGHEVFVLANSAPVRDGAGRVVGAVLCFQDITPIREQEQLRDEFLAAAAHELKTPITTIRGYAELLLRAPLEVRAPLEARALEQINQQTHRINRRVDEMLEVVQFRKARAALSQERFDLGDLAAQVLERMGALSRDRRLTLERAGAAPIAADRERLEEVLVALVDNAVAASRPGGAVDVRVWTADGEARVSVRDHGAGIPLERQAHVFEPFYEAVPPGAPGYRSVVTLGLCLSKLTIERHRGRIWLDSEEGRGTTVYCALPLASGGTEEPSP